MFCLVGGNYYVLHGRQKYDARDAGGHPGCQYTVKVVNGQLRMMEKRIRCW